MTQSAYANSIVNIMLGWLKGFANWVLKLFDLAGSGGVSPLAWLSDNWLKLLIIFIIVGVIIDWLVWMFRWRPYWVWFRRKRILIEDDDFFAGEDLLDAGLYDKKIFGDEMDERRTSRKQIEKDVEEDSWEEEFVVASTVVRRSSAKDDDIYRDDEPKKARKKRDEIDWDSDWDEEPQPRKRHSPEDSPKRARSKREEPRKKKARTEEPVRKSGKAGSKSRPANKQSAAADLFDLEQSDPSTSSFWEDDVFNVENLPGAEDTSAFENGESRKNSNAADDLF